eukprot:Amastigsp_a3912_11.p3 type:complete len:107 gc:universal Amastigsp_a3912_11:165-485(+)
MHCRSSVSSSSTRVWGHCTKLRSSALRSFCATCSALTRSQGSLASRSSARLARPRSSASKLCSVRSMGSRPELRTHCARWPSASTLHALPCQTRRTLPRHPRRRSP